MRRLPASARPTTAAARANRAFSSEVGTGSREENASGKSLRRDFDRLAGGQHWTDVLRLARRAEQIALHLGATERMYGGALFLGLHALGRRHHVAVGGDGNHR